MIYDVCLLLEGTYPYVLGGVAAWARQLIEAMPHLSFAIVYIGPQRPATNVRRYRIPMNVRSFNEVYLFEMERNEQGRSLNREENELIYQMVRGMQLEEPTGFAEAVRKLCDPMKERFCVDRLMKSKEMWQTVTRIYDEHGASHPFIEYFWNFRIVYTPLIKLLNLRLPVARLYHSLSTGYVDPISSQSMASIRVSGG